MIKILLVEDDHIDQLAFKRIFQKHFPNDTIIIVESIKAGIKKYDESSFDFLVLDYNLADGNAFEFLAHPIDTPTVILSGAINDQLIQEAKEKGALDFLLKDTQLQYLPLIMNLIKQHLNFSSALTNTSTSSALSNPKTFDLQFLNKTFDENKTQIKEVLKVFLEYNPIDLDDLILGLKKQDAKILQDKAHKIKSGYRLIGISLATELAEKIEEEAKEIDENLLSLQKKVNKLAHVSKETTELIQQLLKSNYFDQD